LWTDVPFDASLGTDFTVLALSGETRPYQPDGSPAPPMDPANPALDAEHTCFLDETRAIHLHNTDTAIARPWLVTASGEMRIGKDPRSAPIDSVVIWYIKPGGAMGYATVPIGGSRFILGRSLNAFVVETDPRDNVGKVTVTAHSFPTR
jgi:hypothetical protein